MRAREGARACAPRAWESARARVGGRTRAREGASARGPAHARVCACDLSNQSALLVGATADLYQPEKAEASATLVRIAHTPNRRMMRHGLYEAILRGGLERMIGRKGIMRLRIQRFDRRCILILMYVQTEIAGSLK